jgi:AcrR family transcriptional regulator
MTKMRERYRAHVREEVKAAALEQLAAGGPASLSVNAIAKAMGVSGPALYRYFANRDELLTELVLDAYADAAVALETAVAQARPGERFEAFADAYRAWALAQPHRYRLLYAEPLPGYDAQREALVEAAQRLMAVLAGVIAERPAPAPDPRLARQLARWARARGVDLDPPHAHRALTAWTRLHGLVGLEIDGNFDSMGIDPALLYAAEVAALAG